MAGYLRGEENMRLYIRTDNTSNVPIRDDSDSYVAVNGSFHSPWAASEFFKPLMLAHAQNSTCVREEKLVDHM